MVENGQERNEMSKYGDFYAIEKWGFAKEDPTNHPPQPAQFRPAHFDDPKFLGPARNQVRRPRDSQLERRKHHG